MNSPCLFLQRLGVDNLDTPSKPTMPTMPTMRQIAQEVAQRHQLTLERLLGPEVERRVSWPRQEAMAAIYAMGGRSYPQIGRFFHRHHATVIHAVRQVDKRQGAAK